MPQRQKTYSRICAPAMIQITLYIRTIGPESSMSAVWIASDAKFLLANNGNLIRLPGCTDRVEVSLGARVRLRLISPCFGVREHHENIPIYFVPPLIPLLCSKTRIYKGIHYVFLFLLKNIDYGYLLEPPWRGGSNACLQSMFWIDIWKILDFLFENVQLLVVKFSIYLNRRVFVMRLGRKSMIRMMNSISMQI